MATIVGFILDCATLGLTGGAFTMIGAGIDSSAATTAATVGAGAALGAGAGVALAAASGHANRSESETPTESEEEVCFDKLAEEGSFMSESSPFKGYSKETLVALIKQSFEEGRFSADEYFLLKYEDEEYLLNILKAIRAV